MPCDAQTLIEEAVLQGYDSLDDHSLRVAILQLICNGGGGGGVPALPDGEIFVGNASDVATAVPMSGDIGIDNTGATAIQAGVIVNADINAAAAIARSKIAADGAAAGEVLFNDTTTGAITSTLAFAVTTTGLGRLFPLRITLPAGNTAAGGSPLKFQGGALMTTPEAGALEALSTGDLLYYTTATGPTRKQVVLTTDGSAVNSTLTVATDRLLGRDTAGTGAIEEIAIGSGLTLSGGTLSASGGGAPTVTTQSANYVVPAANYVVLMSASGGNRTVTLPAAASGAQVTVKKTDSSSNLVTVDTPGAETIDGAASWILSIQYESVTLISDGTNWFAI